MRIQRVSVFCGSSPGARPEYAQAAADLGRTIAERGMGLVYGGASVGLMGTVADAALEAGGEVIGVIPQGLVDKELAHHGLTDLHVVTTMHERKALIADLSEAVIALPGGFGTLDELFEALTWSQLGILQRPCGLLNVGGFYDSLLAYLDHCVQERFVSSDNRAMLLCNDDPSALLDLCESYQAPDSDKWLDRTQA